MIDPTVGKMYLAAQDLFNVLDDQDFNPEQYPKIVESWKLLDKALTQYELELGPCPDGATWNHGQELVRYAQLFTRNGRQRGNAMISEVVDGKFYVVSDMGNVSYLSENEVHQLFEVGDFIFDQHAVDIRRAKQVPQCINKII